MSSMPKTLKYSNSHEWIRQEEDLITMGITDHAQIMLGELVYVELPEIEMSFEQGQECALVESLKAAVDIYCPVPGEVVEINEALLEHPQLINEDPYGKGWLIRLRPYEKNVGELLDAEQYHQLVASEAH